MYDAATLHLHCSSKPFTNDGSAYPSHTSRFSDGSFFVHAPHSSTSPQSKDSRQNCLVINASPSVLFRRGFCSRPTWSLVHDLAAHHGEQNFGLWDFRRFDLEQILRQHDQIRDFARLD